MSHDAPIAADARSGATLAMWCSVIALLAVLVVRITGPTDLWDQTQPKTVSYTTDIIANGRWILPVERGEFPATKPPLANWLAVPAVAAFGSASEIAHKSSSMLGLVLAWLVIVRTGRWAGGPMVGAWAGMMFVANYTIFKLGYLARPDMVLTACLLVGWAAGTSLLADAATGSTDRPRGLRQAVLWTATALAWLAKGPVGLIVVVYLLVASRVLGGSYRSIHRTGWWWGVPLGIVVFAAWLGGAWLTDPDHVRDTLIYAEVVGRVTGTGPEGSDKGPMGFFIDFPNMALYYLVRFLPWSVLSVLAMVRLREAATPARGSAGRAWLVGSVVWVLVVVAIFTLSTGKRADYIASAFGPGAILAAWWCRESLGGSVAGRRFVAVAAAVIIVALGVQNWRNDISPHPELAGWMRTFIHDANAAIEATDDPVVFWNAGSSHLQAMLGASLVDGPGDVKRLAATGRPLWVVGALGDPQTGDLTGWFRTLGIDAAVEREYHVPPLGDIEVTEWPDEIGLYRIVPTPASDPSS